MIISISGLANSGKDTAALPLIKYNILKKSSFAHNLKLLVSETLNIPYEYLDHTDLKDKPLPDGIIVMTPQILTRILIAANGLIGPINVFPQVKYPKLYTPREVLRYIGTDVVRSQNPTYWIDNIQIEDNSVFTDARFPNERQRLREAGAILVLVKRSGIVQNMHITESSLGSDSEYDYIIENNSTVESLHNSIMNVYHVEATLEQIKRQERNRILTRHHQETNSRKQEA